MKIKALQGLMSKQYRRSEVYLVCPKCSGAFLVESVLFKHTAQGYQLHLRTGHKCGC